MTSTQREALIQKLAAEMSAKTGQELEVCRAVVEEMVGGVQTLGEDERRVLFEADDEGAGELSLVEIVGGGDDGPKHELGAGTVVVGREGDLAFGEDEFLSPRHARIWREGEQVWLEDLGSFNGTYVKVKEPVALEDGDQLLMGRQVLRLRTVKDHAALNERAMEARGVKEMASPAPMQEALLQRVGLGGEVYDSHELDGGRCVLGRSRADDDEEPEQGWADVEFSNDRFMSQRHAAVWREDGAWMLEDLGSSNGTWSRIKGKRELRHGDHVFVGRQLLRFERAGGTS